MLYYVWNCEDFFEERNRLRKRDFEILDTQLNLERFHCINLNNRSVFVHKYVLSILESLCKNEFYSYPIKIKTVDGLISKMYFRLDLKNIIRNKKFLKKDAFLQKNIATKEVIISNVIVTIFKKKGVNGLDEWEYEDYKKTLSFWEALL